MYIGEMGREVKRPIILQGTMAAPKEGHMRLPDQFYQGLHFGLSAWDEWGEKVSMRLVFQAVRWLGVRGLGKAASSAHCPMCFVLSWPDKHCPRPT